jgi:hypothetical protein
VFYPEMLKQTGREAFSVDAERIVVTALPNMEGVMPCLEDMQQSTLEGQGQFEQKEGQGESSGRTLMVLDPRGLILNNTTRQIDYSPRLVPDEKFAAWVRAWLDRHPHWGTSGCETNWDRALSEVQS